MSSLLSCLQCLLNEVEDPPSRPPDCLDDVGPHFCSTTGNLHGIQHDAAIAVSGEPVVGKDLVLGVAWMRKI